MHKHIIISKFGDPDKLHLIEEEIPERGANEVLVKILTAGVSFADILMREGVHPESLFILPSISSSNRGYFAIPLSNKRVYQH